MIYLTVTQRKLQSIKRRWYTTNNLKGWQLSTTVIYCTPFLPSLYYSNHSSFRPYVTVNFQFCANTVDTNMYVLGELVVPHVI